jgi:hypothetical protein
VFVLLVIREVPTLDSVDGYYIGLLLALAKDTPGSSPAFQQMSFLAITEDRIVSLLLFSAVAFAIASIVAGLLAHYRNEPPEAHAKWVTLSTAAIWYVGSQPWLLKW